MQALTVEKFTPHAKFCAFVPYVRMGFSRSLSDSVSFSTAVILGKDDSTHESICRLKPEKLVFSLKTLI